MIKNSSKEVLEIVVILHMIQRDVLTNHMIYVIFFCRISYICNAVLFMIRIVTNE